MDCEWALVELSTAHAVALRMRHADARDEEIATALGIPPDGVAVLLELAQAKLAAVLAEESGDARASAAALVRASADGQPYPGAPHSRGPHGG